MEQQWETVAEISSPGKFIISGQHSVLYDKKAIAAAANNMRSYSKCERRKIGKDQQSSVVFNLVDLNKTQTVLIEDIREAFTKEYEVDSYKGSKQDLKSLCSYQFLKALCLVKHTLSLPQPSISLMLSSLLPYQHRLTITSQIPISKGLGSSGSFSVTLSSSLLTILSLSSTLFTPSLPLTNLLAFQYQKIYHLNPSGVDNFVSTFGGIVVFSKKSFLKNTTRRIQWNLETKIGLIDSKIQRDTKKAIEIVRGKVEKEGKRGVVDRIGEVTERIGEGIQKGREGEVMRGVRENHGLLRELGISIPEIQAIVEELDGEKVAAKITGGGLGGFVLVLASQQINHPGIMWMDISNQGLIVKLSQKVTAANTQLAKL